MIYISYDSVLAIETIGSCRIDHSKYVFKKCIEVVNKFVHMMVLYQF